VIGKDGTDIKDHKCTWLVIQALQAMNQMKMSKEARAILPENYGKDDEKCTERVKELYRSLHIPELFDKQEQDSYDRIVGMMRESADILPPELFQHILDKIHKRQS